MNILFIKLLIFVKYYERVKYILNERDYLFVYKFNILRDFFLMFIFCVEEIKRNIISYFSNM